MQATRPTHNDSFKVIVIGDSGVGKSSLLWRLQSKSFLTGPRPTLGIEFSTHQMIVDGRTVKLKLYDTAGQERFNSLVSSYFRDADGAVAIFDVAWQRSFDDLLSVWLPQAKQLGKDNMAIMLAGNKSDLTASVNMKDVEKYSKDNHHDLQLASAKTGENVELIFRGLIKKMTLLQETPDPDMSSLRLHDHTADFSEEGTSKCCEGYY